MFSHEIFDNIARYISLDTAHSFLLTSSMLNRILERQIRMGIHESWKSIVVSKPWIMKILKVPTIRSMSTKKLLQELSMHQIFRDQFGPTFYPGIANPLEQQYALIKQQQPNLSDQDCWKQSSMTVYETAFKGTRWTRPLTKLCKEHQHTLSQFIGTQLVDIILELRKNADRAPTKDKIRIQLQAIEQLLNENLGMNQLHTLQTALDKVKI